MGFLAKLNKSLVISVLIFGLIFGFLLMLWPPGSISTLGNGWLKALLWNGRYFCIFASVLMYFVVIRVDIFGAIALAYGIGLIISTLLNGGKPWSCIGTYWPQVAALLLVRTFFPLRRKEVLWAVFSIMSIYATLNLASIVAFPVGTPHLHESQDMTFLGHRNGACRSYLTAILVSSVLDIERRARFSFRTAAIIAISFAQCLLAYSATSLVGLCVCLAGLIAIQWRRPRDFLNTFTYLGAYVLAFFAVVVFRVQSCFSPLFETVLHRTTSFTGRVDIWDRATFLLDESHIWFGYCANPQALLVVNGQSFGTAHNAVLDILFVGGITSLLIVFTLFALSAIQLYRNREEPVASIVALALGVFLLMGLTEFIMCVPLCIFIAMGYCFNRGNVPAIKLSL